MAGYEILSPFSKLPELMSATILLVAAPGTGKHTLAKALINIETSFSLHVRISNNLPLSADQDGERPKIDFIVFMLDLTNRESVKVVESAISKVDMEYLLGKCCIVALQASNKIQRSIEVELVSQLSDTYDAMLLFGNLGSEEGRECLSSKIIKLTECAAGFKPYLSPLVIDTTRNPYSTEVQHAL